jgi:dynein regulatry complex protein 1
MDVITDEAGFLLEPKVLEAAAKLPADEAGRVRLDKLLEVLGVTDGAGLEALVAALDPASDVELRAKGMGTAGAEKPTLRDPPLLVAPDEVVRRLRAFVEAEGAGGAGGAGGGGKAKAAGALTQHSLQASRFAVPSVQFDTAVAVHKVLA